MIKATAISDAGNKYTVNEDTYGWNMRSGLFFVADGMGGHAAGEIASGIVRETLLQEGLTQRLSDRVRSAHSAILDAVAADSALAGMGSTVVALQVNSAHYELVWVGDSRAYVWRSGELTRLSRDHSLVQALIDSGEISADQAQSHPQKNVVTQTLGVYEPKPDRADAALQHKDWFLLCSDGLTDELTDDQIADILSRSSSIEIAKDALLTAAKAGTCRDNVTIMMLRYSRYGNGTVIGVGILLFAAAVGSWALFG
jgi:protein phosphatase